MPPIAALSAFEAVVRHASFTAAAEELALTQSAVSRQVSSLENLLGVALLEPNRRRQIVLTASGAFYAEQVRQMLSQLTAATTEAIALGDRGRVLRLGIPPTFGSLWLIPRMQSFFAAYPDVAVEFSTRVPSRPHSGLGNLHALIDFADTPGMDGEWEKLIELELRPVATAQITEAIANSDQAALANAHLLVHSSERANLSGLFKDPKLAALRSQPTLTFESYAMLFQAAIRGLGIAFAPIELIGGDLSAKRLVPVTDFSLQARSTGYLIYQREMAGYPPLAAFRTWLLDTVRESRTTTAGKRSD